MKFITSSYNKDTGEAVVIMQHLGQKFEGRARIHPEENERKSEFAGCRFAETRAMIKALKHERQMVKNETEICRKFVKSIECYSNFDCNSDTAKVVYRQLNRRIKRVNDITDEINKLYQSLQISIVRRETIIDILKKRRTKEEN